MKNTNVDVPYYVRPSIPEDTHPIETARFVINTAPISELLEKISDWVYMNAPGGVVYGLQRIGKSFAIEHIKVDLKSKYGNDLPIVHFNCLFNNVFTKSNFFKERLLDIKHYNIKGTSTTLMQILLNYLLTVSMNHQSRRIIIFMDEAQNLSTQEYHWLVGIYNHLVINGAIPTFILVGQPDLINKRNLLVSTNETQIVGRFMVNTHKFRGLRNEIELKDCLDTFDVVEYPHDSGWSYTRYYFPCAYANGWRIVGEYMNAWTAFKNIEKEYSMITDSYGLSMQYFIAAVRRVMRNFGSVNVSEPHFSVNVWEEAVLKTNYHKSKDIINVDSDESE